MKAEAKNASTLTLSYTASEQSSDMTQQIPVRDGMRESPYTRDAKAYLEKRRQPFQTEENSEKAPTYKEHETLRIVVILLVIIGLVLTVILIQKNGKGQDRKAPRFAPQVISYDPPVTTGLTAPVDLTFFAVTDKDVDGMRLRGENGLPLAPFVIG